MTSTSKVNLVYQVESDILQHSRLQKLSFRTDAGYFAGRAGVIRILNLVLATFSVGLMLTGWEPRRLNPKDEADAELLRLMKSDTFTGYGSTKLTLYSIGLGAMSALISLIFLILLYLYMEVRCDLLWEKVNQKAHVLACILSVAAAFCNLLSIQDVQLENCNSWRCKTDKHSTLATKYAEAFHPPYFIYHYAAFVAFLTNAMLYSIASRIWLRNDD